MITKRLSNDRNYVKPGQTYQQTLSNQEIKEKLKEYKKVDDIRKVCIGTHCRYFTYDPKTKEKLFRLGGNINKIDPEGRFVVLSNGTLSWSVQIAGTLFYQKMTESEYKDELKKEIKKEVMTEMNDGDDETADMKKQIKMLAKKLEGYQELEKKYIEMSNINEVLTSQLKSIEKEINKEKKKNKK